MESLSFIHKLVAPAIESWTYSLINWEPSVVEGTADDRIDREDMQSDSKVVLGLCNQLKEQMVSEQDPVVDDETIRLLRAQVEHGRDADDQFALGARYHTIQAYSAALKFYMMAAMQMHTGAMNNIAVLVNQGKGTIRDEKLALEWFGLASRLGNVKSTLNYAMIRILPSDQSNLNRREGFMMMIGLKNRLEARGEEYVAAARNRLFVRTIYNNLGCMYCRGMGTKADPAKAVKMFEKASELDSAIAKYNIGTMYLNGLCNGAPQQEVANEWFQKAREDQTHMDLPVILQASDSTKLLMVTTLATN